MRSMEENLRAGLRALALDLNDTQIHQLLDYQDLIGNVNQTWLMEPRQDMPKSAEPMVKMRYIHAHRIRHNVATRTPLNPTSDLWRQLLQAGFPFVKRELLRDNPSYVADIIDWRDEVRKNFGEVPDAIERDLRRVMRNRVP